MWKLVIDDDEGKRTVVPLTREQYSIGRKDGNTIRLTERNVSREHARLLKKANGNGEKPCFVLEDLTSYNGVFVNGLRITHSQDLTHGDLVQIGDYHIVLQDEAVTENVADTVPIDVKQTVPHAPAARAAALLDRPNRLVMLAGPTPGQEYPLDQERLTIGRAEDASISVNHNSVSRLHCEVHALGDGRFEIVDKGSSNGVRLNGSDLRRGIVEPGDVIELGDVKFKFIGAGQVFRPTESQQLAAIANRDAELALAGSRRNAVLPFAIFAGVVLIGGAIALVAARAGSGSSTPSSMQSTMVSDQSILDDAKRACAAGDCETAHTKVGQIGENSPLRQTQDFKDVENRWADQVLAKADAETDITRKRALYQRVASTPTVDATRRKIAADKIQGLDAVVTNPTQLPIAASSPNPTDTVAMQHDAGHRRELATDSQLPPPPNPTYPAAVTTNPPPLPPPTPPTGPATGGVTDKDRQLALQDSPEAKQLLKQRLEQSVYSGKASETQIKLLIETCKQLGDRLCVSQARQQLAQKQGGSGN
jgi:pSer/pThr/pTyr-binding forkhead associated (FHA) protein